MDPPADMEVSQRRQRPRLAYLPGALLDDEVDMGTVLDAPGLVTAPPPPPPPPPAAPAPRVPPPAWADVVRYDGVLGGFMH